MNGLPPLRADLEGFAGYRSARHEPGTGSAWLNANESAWANLADHGGRVRRYPEPQPAGLQAALASHYGCPPGELLMCRGSDEAIDLLVRAYCAPGRDAVLATPPVFGMYAVSARLQGARLLEVPLRDAGDDFELDLEQVVQVAAQGGARVVFLCSPGNPAGGLLAPEGMVEVARRLSGQALVVVDEAYVEFAGAPSIIGAARPRNLAVLRTLSKAHALAGARVGGLVADAEVIAALRSCQAPYPVPEPSVRLALAALAPAALARTGRQVAQTIAERERLRPALASLACVRRVYPSRANFLLVRFRDASAADGALRAAGIVARDMRSMPQLDDALRITVGTPSQNDAVLDALRAEAVVPA